MILDFIFKKTNYLVLFIRFILFYKHIFIKSKKKYIDVIGPKDK